MKKIFRRLVCCSFLSIASIGCFDAEARVTKEVAEAVLPYLMEAAGIKGDQHSGTTRRANKEEYENNKIQAILNMIYTDDGQRQMVNWVKTGEFPQLLHDARIVTTHVYSDTKYRKFTLEALFPHMTDTFCSFANNDLRLGKHWLTQKENIKHMLPEFIANTTTYNVRERKNFEGILQNINQFRVPIDILLAKILFILDICDDPRVISNALKLNATILRAVRTSNCEYTCRPISAIISKGDNGEYDGDCVETLYRHLINIAIQDATDLSKFHTEKLPNEVYKYYYEDIDPKHDKVIERLSEAGATDIEQHNKWRHCLRLQLPHQDISFGSLTNISKTLSVLSGTTYQENDLRQTLIDALMKFRSDPYTTFDVAISEKSANSPKWVESEIKITQTTQRFSRIIIIGIANSRGHAEILKTTITPI